MGFIYTYIFFHFLSSRLFTQRFDYVEVEDVLGKWQQSVIHYRQSLAFGTFLTAHLWKYTRGCIVLTAGWSLCTPKGQSRATIQDFVANVCCLGRNPKEFVLFFTISLFCLAALSLPFCPFEPDLWLQFNSCNNTAYYGHDIIHSTISPIALRVAGFFFSWYGKL